MKTITITSSKANEINSIRKSISLLCTVALVLFLTPSSTRGQDFVLFSESHSDPHLTVVNEYLPGDVNDFVLLGEPGIPPEDEHKLTFSYDGKYYILSDTRNSEKNFRVNCIATWEMDPLPQLSNIDLKPNTVSIRVCQYSFLDYQPDIYTYFPAYIYNKIDPGYKLDLYVLFERMDGFAVADFTIDDRITHTKIYSEGWTMLIRYDRYGEVKFVEKRLHRNKGQININEKYFAALGSENGYDEKEYAQYKDAGFPLDQSPSENNKQASVKVKKPAKLKLDKEYLKNHPTIESFLAEEMGEQTDEGSIAILSEDKAKTTKTKVIIQKSGKSPYMTRKINKKYIKDHPTIESFYADELGNEQ